MSLPWLNKSSVHLSSVQYKGDEGYDCSVGENFNHLSDIIKIRILVAFIGSALYWFVRDR